MKTILMTDSCSDLPLQYVKDNNIQVITMTYNFKNKDTKDDFGTIISNKDFYDIRNN